MIHFKRIIGILLTLVLTPLWALPAFAASDAAINAKIEKLEREIEVLAREVQELKRSTASQSADTRLQQRQQQTVVQLQQAPPAQLKASDVKAMLDNGRPTFATSDGRFTASVRALGQFDAAYYMQGGNARKLPAANGPDLSSGFNFRRAWLGIQGRAFGDWSYSFNYDFGGSGNEQSGRIQALYVQYDGLKPWAFRIGAYPPPAGLEDGTAAGDTIFLERNSPADLARNIAGADGRDAASVLYAGDRIFGALSYTGGKAADSTLYFDEQNALLWRLSGVVYADANSRFVLSGNGTYVFKVGDASAGTASARNITLSDPPELTVDDQGIKLVSTGAINAESVREWGLEAGGNWKNFYAQAGYFGYGVDRRATPLPDLNFSGWYAQATWVLTGESKGYNTANAAFTPPQPVAPFALDGSGWGAWEFAGRYSDLDLNDNEGPLSHATPVGGIRGGEQKIWTVGLNWYPNTVIRFALDYQWIDVNRLSATGANVGQTVQAVALRSQLSF